MIVTDTAHLAEQATLTPALKAALAWLQRTEAAAAGAAAMPDGRIDIDGDRVYALVQRYATQAGGEWTFEGHLRYLDVQYIAAGEEVIGWAPAERATVGQPYDPAKDAWLGSVAADQITALHLAAGQLAVFYPHDAHAPKRAGGASAPVVKIVIKVAV